MSPLGKLPQALKNPRRTKAWDAYAVKVRQQCDITLAGPRDTNWIDEDFNRLFIPLAFATL